MTMHLRASFSLAIVALLVLPAPARATAPAAESRTVLSITIAAGDLNAALKTLAKQTGIQLLYDHRAVRGAKTAGVTSAKTAEEALIALLEGTPFTYHADESGAMFIEARGSARGAGVSPAGQMQMARAPAAAQPLSEAAASTESTGNVVVVTDSRTRPAPFSTGNLDLTRTEDDVLPFQVFDAREIELSGVTTLQEFLRERLPQNFSLAIPEESDGAASDSVSRIDQVDLRGWGAAETVFLLNGRRMPNEYQGSSLEFANATPNLRAIPVATIERIEILSSAGSAIYGANATGGVINIITRQDVSGGQLSVNYASPDDVSAPRRGVQLSYRLPVLERVSLNWQAGYADSQPLKAGDRSGITIERWRQRAGISASQLGGLTPFAARPNYRAVSTAGDLFPDVPGQQLYAHPMAGYAGGGGLGDFATDLNLELAEGTAGNNKYAKGSLLGPETASVTLGLGTQVNLGRGWSWSIDSRYARSESEGRPNSALSFTSSSTTAMRPRVPAGAPGNPFNQDVLLYIVDPQLDWPGARNSPRNATLSLSTTLNGQVGQWRGFLDVNYSHNRNDVHRTEFYEPAGGWYEAFMSGRYDPFVDIRQAAPASPDFYEHFTVRREYYSSATRNFGATLKASGPVWRLPAGEVQLTGGLDFSRNDRYRAIFAIGYEDATTGEARSPAGTAPSWDESARRRFVFDSYAAYAETTVPLISVAQDVPLVRSLEFMGSGRLDYTVRDGFATLTSADIINGVPPRLVEYSHTTELYALGLKWQPVQGVALRVSRSIGFRPPTVDQVTPGALPDQTCCAIGGTPLDPVRNEGVALSPDMYLTGGNPDLRPESTHSTNLGLILTPARIPALRLSVDYVENIRDDAIFAFSSSQVGGASAAQVQDALSLESEIPGLVIRGPADGHASGVGPVQFVDLRQRNLRRIASKSVDFSAGYRLGGMAGGDISVNARASKNLSYKVQNSNTGPAEEQIRRRITTSGASRQIEWNGNAQLRWDGPHWGVGWNARYFDYILLSAVNATLLANSIQGQGADRIPWRVNHDLNVSYRAPQGQGGGLLGFMAGASVTFTVQNVFNRPPRFWYPSTDYGVAPGDSIAGRMLSLSLRKDL